jgi:hypothetical protein
VVVEAEEPLLAEDLADQVFLLVEVAAALTLV